MQQRSIAFFVEEVYEAMTSSCQMLWNQLKPKEQSANNCASLLVFFFVKKNHLLRQRTLKRKTKGINEITSCYTYVHFQTLILPSFSILSCQILVVQYFLFLNKFRSKMTFFRVNNTFNQPLYLQKCRKYIVCSRQTYNAL